MQLSQQTLLGLFCASFIAGFSLALFYGFLYVIRLCIIPSGSRYTVPTIQNQIAKRAKKRSKKTRGKSSFFTFLSDILFCIVGAITLILILYWFNSGAFRAEAPICMAVGFYLCHRTVSKSVRIILEWFLFAIETAFYALLMPFRYLLAWMVRTHKKNQQKRRSIRFAKERKTNTQKQLQSINRTTEMLLPFK